MITAIVMPPRVPRTIAGKARPSPVQEESGDAETPGRQLLDKVLSRI